MRKSVFYFIVIALLSIIFTSYSPAANAQAACTPGNAVPCPNGGSCQCAGNGCFCDTTVFPVCNPAGDVVKQCGGQNYDCVFRNGTYGCVSYPDPGTTGNPNDTGGGGAVITPIDRGGSCWTVNDNEVPQNKLTPTCAPTVRRTPTPAPSCTSCLANSSPYLCTSSSVWGSSKSCSKTDISTSTGGRVLYPNSLTTTVTCQRCEAPTATPTNTPTPVNRPLACGSIGDVDNNGKINEDDALAILKILSGNINPSDDQKKRADVSGNGTVGIEDPLAVRKYVSGLISTFDACPTPTVAQGLSCDPVKTGDSNGKIDQLDFQLWKDEYTSKNGNISSCLSPNKVVDLLGFQVWRDIYVLKIKKPF